MSLRPQEHGASPLGLHVGRAANDYAEPSGFYIAEILRRFVQFIDTKDWHHARAKVFDALLTLSFGAQRSVARLPEQSKLRRLTGDLGEEVLSRAIGDLEKKLGILTHWRVKKEAGAHRERRTGGMMYRIDPDPANWRVCWRLDAAERKLAIDEWAWIYSYNLYPQAPSLPLPSDIPGLADALRELARDAALAHPLTNDFPPRSEAGRTFRDAGTPDNKQSPCRRALIGNEPPAGVREADTPAAGSVAETPAAYIGPSAPRTAAPPPPASDTAGLPAHMQPTPQNIAAAISEMRRNLGLPPRAPAQEEVSSGANFQEGSSVETGASKLAPELTALAHAGTSDVSEHLHLEHPVSGKAEIYLSSPLHPDGADECRRHQEKPDGAAAESAPSSKARVLTGWEQEEPPAKTAAGPQPGDYTGHLVEDLIRAMGQEAYAEYRGAWESYVACDRAGVVQTLADYKLARLNPHRRHDRRLRKAGAWMGFMFTLKSRKWKERCRGR